MNRMEQRRRTALDRAREYVAADEKARNLDTIQRVRLELEVAEYLYGERGRFMAATNPANGPVTAARLQGLNLAGRTPGPAGGSTQSV